MDFLLFLLVNGVLFLRPGEIYPPLEEYQIYLFLIAACLVVAGPKVVQQLGGKSLSDQPATVCVLGVGAFVVLSLMRLGQFGPAKDAGIEFGKVILYFLLLLAVVDTPQKLRWFLLWLVFCVVVLAGLSVLGYHGVVQLPGASFVEESRLDPETGVMVLYRRLQGTGIFGDPNDMCLALALGMAVSAYALGHRDSGPLRVLWLLPLALFAYTLKLTESRGGMLAVLVGALILFRARLGWRKALLFFAPLVPLVLLAAGGRQSGIDPTDQGDTGQQRVQIWAEGFICFRQSPLFGVGYGNYADATGTGLVAHNSYVHGFTELGYFGGTFFVALFALTLWQLERLFSRRVTILDPALKRLHPYLTAAVAAYGVGLYSLSRNYVVPTYLVVGMAATFLRQVQTCPAKESLGLVPPTWPRLGAIGLASVAVIYALIRVLARYGPA